VTGKSQKEETEKRDSPKRGTVSFKGGGGKDRNKHEIQGTQRYRASYAKTQRTAWGREGSHSVFFPKKKRGKRHQRQSARKSEGQQKKKRAGCERRGSRIHSRRGGKSENIPRRDANMRGKREPNTKGGGEFSTVKKGSVNSFTTGAACDGWLRGNVIRTGFIRKKPETTKADSPKTREPRQWGDQPIIGGKSAVQICTTTGGGNRSGKKVS